MWASRCIFEFWVCTNDCMWMLSVCKWWYYRSTQTIVSQFWGCAKACTPCGRRDAYLNSGCVQTIVCECWVCANDLTKCECWDEYLNYAYVRIVVFEFHISRRIFQFWTCTKNYNWILSLCKWLYPIWNFNGGTSPGPWTLARGSGPDLAQALALGQDLAPASCSLYPYPRFAKSSQFEGVLVGFSLWLASQPGLSKTTNPLEYIKNVWFFWFVCFFLI